MFSAVISEHFSKNRMIISVVAAKIWYLRNVQFLLGHPVYTEVVKLGGFIGPRTVVCKLACINTVTTATNMVDTLAHLNGRKSVNIKAATNSYEVITVQVTKKQQMCLGFMHEFP